MCRGKSVEVRGHCGNKFFLHVGTGDWTHGVKLCLPTKSSVWLGGLLVCLTWFFFFYFLKTLWSSRVLCSSRGVTQSEAPHTSSWWCLVQGSSPFHCSEAAVEWMQTLSRRAAVHTVFKANSVPLWSSPAFPLGNAHYFINVCAVEETCGNFWSLGDINAT